MTGVLFGVGAPLRIVSFENYLAAEDTNITASAQEARGKEQGQGEKNFAARYPPARRQFKEALMYSVRP